MDGLWTTLPCVFVVLTVLCQNGLANDEDYGAWGAWGKWSSCDSKCGSGVMKKVREWIPGPKFVSSPDDGPYLSTQILSCVNSQIPHCPVNGEWSEWSSWSDCTKPCGEGKQTSKRICGGQKYNGKPCEGDETKRAACNRDRCPILPRNFQMSQCTDNNFTCASNLMCIQGSQKCDSTVQCHDGSDEMGCPKLSRWTGSVKYDLSTGGRASTMSLPGVLQMLTLTFVIASLVTSLRISI